MSDLPFTSTVPSHIESLYSAILQDAFKHGKHKLHNLHKLHNSLLNTNMYTDTIHPTLRWNISKRKHMYPTSCDILQGYADGTSLNTKANTVESLETIYTKRVKVIGCALCHSSCCSHGPCGGCKAGTMLKSPLVTSLIAHNTFHATHYKVLHTTQTKVKDIQWDPNTPAGMTTHSYRSSMGVYDKLGAQFSRLEFRYFYIVVLILLWSTIAEWQLQQYHLSLSPISLCICICIFIYINTSIHTSTSETFLTT